MIKFNNVSFSYDESPLITDFNLNISKGDRICFFGESGCGKTTLLRLILGLEKQQNGEIIIDKNLKPSVVFQENRLLPFKTVYENVALFSSEKTDVSHHLKALGIEHCANDYPKELSGGMKRRVAIARALSADFDFLCLDEPFTGLDNENLTAAAEHILNTANERPIILVTHSLDEAKLFSAKIINT